MPELPEVETIRNGLANQIVGHKILSVQVRTQGMFFGEPELLKGQTITEIGRRAKILIWHLTNGYILIHLKMTGQLIFQPKDGELVIGGHPDKVYGLKLPHAYTHVILEFDNGTLYFNDLRKFGWMKFVLTDDELKKEVGHLGPEYTWSEFNFNYFQAGLKKRRITVKQTLLDQTFIAGIGNIYADESLFCARVNPKRKANELTDVETKKLFNCIPAVFNLSLSHGGTSSQHYRQIDGKMGTFLDVANVYKREGQPCKVCGTPIVRIKISGRSSHFCPSCQT